MNRDTRKATAHYVSSPLADPEPVVFVADASVTQQDNATTAAPAATTAAPPAATTRVERFDRRGTEPFEPFEPFEFFQNRNFPEFFL